MCVCARAPVHVHATYIHSISSQKFVFACASVVFIPRPPRFRCVLCAPGSHLNSRLWSCIERGFSPPCSSYRTSWHCCFELGCVQERQPKRHKRHIRFHSFPFRQQPPFYAAAYRARGLGRGAPRGCRAGSQLRARSCRWVHPPACFLNLLPRRACPSRSCPVPESSACLRGRCAERVRRPRVARRCAGCVALAYERILPAAVAVVDLQGQGAQTTELAQLMQGPASLAGKRIRVIVPGTMLAYDAVSGPALPPRAALTSPGLCVLSLLAPGLNQTEQAV